MAVSVDDPHFRQFAQSLEKAIETFGETEDESFLQRQRRQVETLVMLERQFRQALVKHAYGPGVYRAFVEFICKKRRNILDARPYFRERQHVFTRFISRALRRREVEKLYRFRFNYRFVMFALRARRWHPGSVLRRLASQIADIRDELVVMNMPLAISRARIFFSRTPKAHLTYMDLIQIACEGLMSGVDKFVPPFSKAFRAVAIGRMTGNFIENYSETMIHFYPEYKRKLYRANKFAGRQPTADFEVLAEKVNEGAEPQHRTTAAEIASLMAAASTVSTDTPAPGDDEDAPRVADRFAAPADCQPDVIAERQDSMRRLAAATSKLTPFERKLLRLKGVQLGDSLYG